VKGKCKVSVIPSKDQTYKSWASKKEKRCKHINKIIAENSRNLVKEMCIQVQEVSTSPIIHDQNTVSPWNIIVESISTENKKRILKVRKKN
jgi:hypothetical protein